MYIPSYLALQTANILPTICAGCI